MAIHARDIALGDRAENLRSIAEEVARNLATVELTPNGAYITTPLNYPGGGCVTVMLAPFESFFLVSDAGFGMIEAEMMGAASQFARVAPGIAADAGVEFDQQSFFVSKCRHDDLVGIVGAVANCSKAAVDLAALRLSEKKYAEKEGALVNRLVRLFGEESVSVRPKLSGASSHDWTVAASIALPDRQSVFDFVKPSPQSIFAAVAKFGDLARLPHPPKRIAVVHRVEALKEYSGLLSHNASIIEEDAPDDVFKRAA
jgi:hypothetical protein